MSSLPSREFLAGSDAARSELASNTPSGNPLNHRSTASDPSASKMSIDNPRNANIRGQPIHWSTQEKTQLWNANKQYGGDIPRVYEYFSEMRREVGPYRSMDSLSKKLRELLTQHEAICEIFQMAKCLYWSKTEHKIRGTDRAEIRTLLRKLEDDAPYKDGATNRSYADYFCSSKKLEWFSICCGDLHNPGNEQAPTPPTMPQKRGRGRPRKKYLSKLCTPPSMAPRLTDCSPGSSSFTPTTTFHSRSEAATAGRTPLAAHNMDEEFMVPRSPETEDELRHGRPAHSNAANSASVANPFYPPANSTQPLASRVSTAAPIQAPSPPSVPAPVPIAPNHSPRAEDPARIIFAPAHNAHSSQYVRPQPPTSSNYQRPRVDSPVHSDQPDQPDQSSPYPSRPAKRKRSPSIKSERGGSASCQIIDLTDDSDVTDLGPTTDLVTQIMNQIKADIIRLHLTVEGQVELYSCFANEESGKFYLGMSKIAEEVRLKWLVKKLKDNYEKKGKNWKALFEVRL